MGEWKGVANRQERELKALGEDVYVLDNQMSFISDIVREQAANHRIWQGLNFAFAIYNAITQRKRKVWYEYEMGEVKRRLRLFAKTAM